ncbi:Outer membrane porin F [Fibrisoma limi BUZ 3]|uniref:Outer membrane porin F n=1 Tax=Fibrisoma limi BUZ 3 TaxID=1185876 RepID=I2GDP2_9BACT|nr:OmpA family protein [Fibrisoma limi]CCH52016.1 Outer membrane porin F [Fibrisoma limi BUZ 3]
MRKNYLNVCLLFLLIVPLAQAQNRPYEGEYKLNTWSITLAPGLTQFYGDLRQYSSPFKLGREELITGGLGLSLNKQISHLFGAYVNATVGQLSGSKNEVYNAYFRTPLFIQGTLNGTVNLKSLLLGTRKLRRWKADLHAGAGMMWFYTDVYSLADGRLIRYSNDRLDYSSRTAGRWEGSGTTFTRELVIPVGFNLHYELTPRFDLGLDYTYNHVNTEKLDMTVGSDIPGYNDNSSNIFLFRKGESPLDKWGFMSVTLTYKLGRNAAKAERDGTYDAARGTYHLRWTDPADLVKPPYNPTLSDADSIAKANMPDPVDPRLYTDTDKDGVADLFDKQPDTPEGSVVSGGGVAMNLDSLVSSLMRSKLKSECDTLLSNIEFDTDKAIIRPASQEALRQVAELLNVRPNCRIILIGHADARASDNYNQQLSKRRVEAAKRFLVRAGLTDPSRVTLEYYGELRPITGNRTSAGLQSNRRVEIRIEPMNDLRSRYPAGFRPKGRR